uniref:Uncharacterized protein n=1 Tax=Micrurus lemniscatus lemniscatus TaxID=129467 RepID=A0A2D4JT48_MICLE
MELSEEVVGVKDFDHLIPVQFVGFLLAGHGVPTPEDPSLAQPLDEDALFVAVQKDTPFQVPKELSGNLPLPLVGYQLCRGELYVFQAIVAIGRLSQGDPAAFGSRGGCVSHRLPSIVEVDHHLGVG